jgi:hypothetical protein
LASGTFQKNSLDWQIQLFQRRVSEWLEWLLSNPSDSTDSSWQLPEWVLEAVFWIMVVGVVGWAGWQLYKLLYPYIAPYFAAQPQTLSDRSPHYIQASALTTAEWLKRSQLAQQQGNYREACRALYMATLQRLNDTNLIQQEPSRTDGEYLTLSQGLNPPSAYQLLIQTHERLYFSGADISREVYDRCWQAYGEIESAGTGNG